MGTNLGDQSDSGHSVSLRGVLYRLTLGCSLLQQLTVEKWVGSGATESFSPRPNSTEIISVPLFSLGNWTTPEKTHLSLRTSVNTGLNPQNPADQLRLPLVLVPFVTHVDLFFHLKNTQKNKLW